MNDNLRGTFTLRLRRDVWAAKRRQVGLCQQQWQKVGSCLQMVTRIVSNPGKRNGKPFRINARADNFYGILQLLIGVADVYVSHCQEKKRLS
jgi:hypothetical protein